MSRRRVRGVSLVEAVVVVAIAAAMATAAMPSVIDMMTGARVGSAADLLQSEFALARGEAMKRNRDVTLVIQGRQVWAEDSAPLPGDPRVLRQPRELPDGVVLDDQRITFGNLGEVVWPQATVRVDVRTTAGHCGADRTCPWIQVEQVGAILRCPGSAACG